VLDEVARRVGCRLRRSLRHAAIAGRARHAGHDLLLVKPTSYMNRSGPVVAAVLRRRGVSPADLVVALDDADLPVGALRVRKKGSSGGHRGLASVIESLGTDDFPRVRVGVGRDEGGGALVEHVLSRFGAGDRGLVDAAVAAAAGAVLCVVESGTEAAMNRFNGPARGAPGPGA
jgi:PTH1 family peptidyl-tRNA hydrolase